MSDGSHYDPAAQPPPQSDPTAQVPPTGYAPQPQAYPQPGQPPHAGYAPEAAAAQPSDYGAPPTPPPAGAYQQHPGTAGGPTGSAGLPMSLILSIASIVLMVLAVSLKEDGINGWKDIAVWSAFAIVAAVATLAPALAAQLKLAADKAWTIGAAGAVGLIAFWVLIVLPSIDRNVSFLATIGVAAGCVAVWLAPGRSTDAGQAGTGW